MLDVNLHIHLIEYVINIKGFPIWFWNRFVYLKKIHVHIYFICWIYGLLLVCENIPKLYDNILNV